VSRFRGTASDIRQRVGGTLAGSLRLRSRSGKIDILIVIIAIVALLIVGALIFVLLQLMGQSEEHVEKVRKTKVPYKESLRWRSENELGESRIRRDLEQDPNRLTLDYGDTNLDESCLKMIGRMSRLQELRLTRSTVKSSWLAHITGLPLQNLALHGTPIGDKAVRYILMIPTLNRLEIGDTNVSDQGLKQLSESRSIRYLGLSVGRRITNDGIKYVGKMPQLVSLELDDSAVVDGKCLAYLTGLTNLGNINLESVNVKAEDFRPLASLKTCDPSIWVTVSLMTRA
jgi:hypothetical protein